MPTVKALIDKAIQEGSGFSLPSTSGQIEIGVTGYHRQNRNTDLRLLCLMKGGFLTFQTRPCRRLWVTLNGAIAELSREKQRQL